MDRDVIVDAHAERCRSDALKELIAEVIAAGGPRKHTIKVS